MLDKMLERINNRVESFSEIFADNPTLIVNSAVFINGIEDIKSHIQMVKNSLNDINIGIEQLLFKSDDREGFIFCLKGIHSGIFMGFLPSNISIKIIGNVTMFLNSYGKVEKLYIFYDKKSIEQQILPDKSFTLPPESISNDLTGVAKNIFKLVLSTRKNITDSKQVLVDALRMSTKIAPDISLIDMNKIETLKLQTSMQRKIISTTCNPNLEIFIYSPINKPNDSTLPTILYLHGGGWCIGSPEKYDTVNRMLAVTNNANVVCPRYRLCPEHPYPAGFDDCFNAYLFCKNIDNGLYLNTNTVIVAGDSVGGTFAASLMHRIVEERHQLPNAVLLFSPATDMKLENYPSFNKNTKDNIMIDAGLLGFIRGCYISGDLWNHPYISPIEGDLSYFPKTFIMVGSVDPLFDENMAFIQKLQEQSQNNVDVLIGDGMPHHYHTFIGVVDEADEVFSRVAKFIRKVIA